MYMQEPTKPGIATLVGGIVDDAEHLVNQQVELFKREVRQELNQAKRAAISALLGVGVAGMGALLLLIMLAQGLAVGADIPLWISYGIVGGGTAAIGAALIMIAKKEAAGVELLPPPETAGAIKENYQWVTRQRRD
jgi:hypothetical protein